MTCPYFCSLRDHHGRSQKLSDQRVLFLLFPTPDRSQMKCRGLFFGEPFFLLRCQRRASFVSFRLIPPPSLAHPNHLQGVGSTLFFQQSPGAQPTPVFVLLGETLFFPVLSCSVFFLSLFFLNRSRSLGPGTNSSSSSCFVDALSLHSQLSLCRVTTSFSKVFLSRYSCVFSFIE